MITAILIFELLFFIGAVISVDKDSDFFAATFVLLGLGALFFGAWVNPIAWVFENVWLLLGGFVAWFIVGAFWALFKWWSWLSSSETQEKIARAHEEYLSNSSEYREAKTFDKSNESRVFHPGLNKARIVRWIVWWPFSMAWALTYRLVRRVSMWVYDRVVDVLQSISKTQINRAIKNK